MDAIPKFLQYFIPGYWTLVIFKYFCSKKLEAHITNIMSCVISYILLTTVSMLRLSVNIPKIVIPDNEIINSFIAIILGTIIAILISMLFSAKWFSKITVKIFHKTLNDEMWRDVLDLENGSNLKIYLRNEPYYIIGHHKNHEEKGEESWLAVSAFAKYDKNTNKNYNNEPSFLDDENVIYTIRFSDIEHIEIF